MAWPAAPLGVLPQHHWAFAGRGKYLLTGAADTQAERNERSQVRDLRSQLAQQAEHAREAASGPSPEAVAEMQVCAGGWLCNSDHLACCLSRCGVQCLVSLELGEQKACVRCRLSWSG